MDCKYGSCWFDLHHVFWPKRKYRTKLERRFRNLNVNTVKICRCEHDKIHATQKPPKKPSVQDMQHAVNQHQ